MGSAVGWPRDRRVDERWPFGANLRWQCGRLWAGLRSSLGNMISWNTNEIQSRGGLPLVPNSGLDAVPAPLHRGRRGKTPIKYSTTYLTEWNTNPGGYCRTAQVRHRTFYSPFSSLAAFSSNLLCSALHFSERSHTLKYTPFLLSYFCNISLERSRSERFQICFYSSFWKTLSRQFPP